MSTYAFVNTMQAKAGRQGELVELLRDLAVSMHAEPGRLHYSVHRAIGDENGPVTVIQGFASLEAVEAHAAWMEPHLPELVSLLDAPPDPPVLLEPVVLSGHPLESFGAPGATGA
jgi:quinol monooxygenase YgiN